MRAMIGVKRINAVDNKTMWQQGFHCHHALGVHFLPVCTVLLCSGKWRPDGICACLAYVASRVHRHTPSLLLWIFSRLGLNFKTHRSLCNIGYMSTVSNMNQYQIYTHPRVNGWASICSYKLDLPVCTIVCVYVCVRACMCMECELCVCVCVSWGGFIWKAGTVIALEWSSCGSFIKRQPSPKPLKNEHNAVLLFFISRRQILSTIVVLRNAEVKKRMRH